MKNELSPDNEDLSGLYTEFVVAAGNTGSFKGNFIRHGCYWSIERGDEMSIQRVLYARGKTINYTVTR